MAKIRILGDAAVVTSSLKMADIEKLNKFRPKALIVKDEETKEPLYTISTHKIASFDNNGIEFNGTDNAGYAIATLQLPNGLSKEQKKAYIVDRFASAILSLNNAETEIAAAYHNLTGDMRTAESAITFIDDAVAATEEAPSND